MLEYLSLILGSIGLLINVISNSSQIHNIIERKSADDISYIALIGYFINSCIWITYTYIYNSYLSCATFSLNASVVLLSIVLKYYYFNLKKKAVIIPIK